MIIFLIAICLQLICCSSFVKIYHWLLFSSLVAFNIDKIVQELYITYILHETVFALNFLSYLGKNQCEKSNV